jgi:putative sterol carrier protein
VASTRDGNSGAANRVSRFFADLETREHEPLLARTTGTLQFDLSDGDTVDRWFVTVTSGNIQVSRDEREADVAFELDSGLFAAMAEGRLNAMAAVLRDEVRVVGDLGLAMSFQRLFPGPPDAVGPGTPAHRAGASR